MSKNLIEKLKLEFEPSIIDMGYELVDIEFIKENYENYLRFYIYSENGIDIDDCEKVSRYLDVKLDEIDPIDVHYYLEVSSPDLNRPLKTDDDLRRNVGEIIEVHLYKKVNGLKDYIGELKEYNSDEIKLLSENIGEVVLNRKDISLIKIWLEF
ncbi:MULTISPECIES: ribosome maturation factor RimP [Helcococcus]|uniref:Ribosome maturation factor RimP n=1 Tax=Helcococcus bovis TaxID=3153252 RepID=A0ABW9F6U0_9FIRM